MGKRFGKIEHIVVEFEAAGVGCADCGLDYYSPRWMDAVLPNDVWQRISPTGDEGGLLCIGCMAARLKALGLDYVPCKITSGPFAPRRAHVRLPSRRPPFADGKHKRNCHWSDGDECECGYRQHSVRMAERLGIR